MRKIQEEGPPSEPTPAETPAPPEQLVTPPEAPGPVSESFVQDAAADSAAPPAAPAVTDEAAAEPADIESFIEEAEASDSGFVEDTPIDCRLEPLPVAQAEVPETEGAAPEPEPATAEPECPPPEPDSASPEPVPPEPEPEDVTPPAPEPPVEPVKPPPAPAPKPAARRPKPTPRRREKAAPGKRPSPKLPLGAWNPERVDPVVVAFHDRYSAVCEQYRSVRARLLTTNTSRAAQVIGITSAIPEEGKSVTALNLSLVMAEGGEHRILLADADFRRASIARMLGIPEHPGLAEVLRGEIGLMQALQPTPFPNLKVLTAGRVRDNGYAELLGGNAIAAALEEFRNNFDYTFMDTPPITTVSDVCLLAPQSDGVIVVIQMRRTPEPTVQQAVRTLQANNIKILGSILSRYRERGAGYYEHYYSSYYYR